MKVHILATLSGALLRDFLINLTHKTTASDWESFIEKNQIISDEDHVINDFQPQIITTFFLLFLESPQEQKDALLESIPEKTIMGLVYNNMMQLLLRNPSYWERLNKK